MAPKKQKKQDTQKKARPRGAVSLPGGRRVLHAWRCRCLRVRLIYFRTACTHGCMSSARGVRETVAHAEGRCCCFLCETSACIFYNDKGRKGAMMLTDAARPLELRTWQPTRYPGAEVQVDSRWLPARKNTGGHRRCRQRDGNTLANNRRWHLIFWFQCQPSPATQAPRARSLFPLAGRQGWHRERNPKHAAALLRSALSVKAKGGAGRTLNGGERASAPEAMALAPQRHRMAESPYAELVACASS